MVRRWVVPEPRPEAEAALRKELGVSRLLARLLANRGITTPAEGEAFLFPDLHHLHEPGRLKDMGTAVERIAGAVAAKQRITLYSDYDVDGVTGTSILYHFFRTLGLAAATYVPERRREGYGLNVAAIEKIHAGGCQLLITVDCGIGGAEPVARARGLGLDCIVTDHHEPPETLPPALAVIDHRRHDCEYPFKKLCGAGVAFKLAWGVAQRLSGATRVTPEFRRYLVEAMALAAVGTIADVVPLQGENRILACFGLRCLASSRFVGLRSLIESAELAGRKIGAEEVAFRIGPRLNAAGRMGSAARALELLTTEDAARGRALAAELDKENRERQRVERQIAAEAFELAGEQGAERQKVIVLARDGWHPGVIGIVASRLVERFTRPVVLVALDGDSGRGSARSIEDYHVLDALLACQSHLERLGGHARAAGFEIRRERCDAFRAALEAEVGRTLPESLLEPRLALDAEASFDEIDDRLVEEIERLEPTGEGNPPARLAARDVEVVGVPRQMGADGKHLALWLRQGKRSFRAVAFGQGSQAGRLEAGHRLDIAFRPGINHFGGNASLELYLDDLVRS